MNNTELLELLGTDPRDAREQLSGLSGEQLSGLSGEQLSWLSGEQLSWLSGEQLSWLSGEQLSGLSREQLSWLSGEQLSGLSGEQLSWLSGEQLSGLSGEQLSAIQKMNESTPILQKPYSAILEATNNCSERFDMSTWHCGTTHCAAGHIVNLAGMAGYDLEASTGSTVLAARLILLKSCPPDWPLPNFYASNEAVAAFIRKMASKEKDISA